MYDNDDLGYARGRLVNTIIRYNGKAVIVQAVELQGADRPLRVYSVGILSGEPIVDDIDKFDGTPVPLGFVNYREADVSYVERKPMRNDWRQGLRAENMFVALRPKRGLPWNHKAIARTVEGIFPSLEGAIKTTSVPDTDRTVAFHRHFAVSGVNSDLIYRTFGKVGQIMKDRTFLLDAKFGWVEDRLRAVL